MVRTLVIAAFVTLFGAATSEAQYQDSYPPDESYDEELLGPRGDDGGYDEPDIDVGIFAGLGHDGRWHFAADFGWVWRPYTAAGWRPYSDGRWVWTSHGWTWVSYEPYGWATYHYGYWATDARLGWVWIPGYEWSACRVQWAYYDNYISWAPLAPPGYYCPRPWTTAGFSVWFTVGARNFCDPYPTRYCERPRYSSVYVERVKYKSPDRHFIEQSSGRTIRTATVDFKHKSWSKSEGSSAKISSGKHFQKSRTVDRVRVDKVATRSRDVATKTWNAPKSGARSESRLMKTQQRTTTREVRAVRTDRPAKVIKQSRVVREERSIQKPARASRDSRASFQASRSSDTPKSVATVKKSERREVARVKSAKSGKGRGKAK